MPRSIVSLLILLAALAGCQEEHLAYNPEDLRILQQENETLIAQIAAYDAELARCREDLDAITDILAQCAEESRQLQQGIEAERQQVQQARDQKASLTAQRDDAQAQLAQAQHRISQLEEELAACRADAEASAPPEADNDS